MENEKNDFDFKKFEEQAIKRLQDGHSLEGKDGVLALSNQAQSTSGITN